MTDKEIIKSARKTLLASYEAIKKQSQNLPENFPEIARIISENKGKIVFCGVGKSGHICKKLSSTFSSIGSPSVFLHPTDANHGDLGLIRKKDLVFFISKSGNSQELKNIVLFTLREKIKTIAICSEKESFLAKNSTYPLITVTVKEACPFDLVPTTSTSIGLALGDALAIEVMKLNKISRETFGKNHPSGNIGAKFIKVEKLMRTKKDLPLVFETDDMKKTLLEITIKGLGVAGVLNKKKELVGIITDGDLRRNFSSILKNNAQQTMTKNPITIDENILAIEALSLMNKKSITSLFVNKKHTQKPKGIIHIHDCIKGLKNAD